MARRILIVGDDLDTTEVVTHCLAVLGCTVETETDATELMARLGAQVYAGMILILTFPEASGVTILRQLRQSGSTIPVIVLSGNTAQAELMTEGAQAVLTKPCEGREFKRAFLRVVPPTREELIRDHSEGESTIWLNAQTLAKAGAFLEARKAIALLDEGNSQRMAYIELLSYQVLAGDLEGAKATVHGAPSLRIGGHWVRCMTNALVQAGDVRGAWTIADHIDSVEERSFSKGIIVAQQIAAGDLVGAKTTFLRFSPREITGRDRAAGAIAHALVTEGNIEDALRFVCHMETGELKMSVLREVFRVQIQRGGRADAERLAAGLKNHELRHEARTAIQTLEQGCDENAHILKAGAMNFTQDTFASLYPAK